jgi:tetratricopeptide (TPR) repeat protein
MRARATIILMLTCCAYAQAQSRPADKPMSEEILARVRPIMDALYRLDYPQAESLCQRLIQDFPEHPAGYVYRERTYFSEELSRARLWSASRALSMDLFSDAPKFNLPVAPETEVRFQRAANEATEKAHAWLSRHPDDVEGTFLLGSAYAFKSSYELSIRHSRLSASKDASRTFKVISGLVRRHADVVDARAITGAFSVVAASLDFKTKLVALLFLGINGDLNGGRRDLEDANERAFVENDDAGLLLSILYTRERKYDLALDKLARLGSRYPDNYLVQLEMAALHLIAGKPNAAARIYRDLLARNSPQLERAIVLSRLGVASRMAGQFAESERWLRDAVAGPASSSPSSSIARLELGKTLDLQGRRANAVEQYRMVLGSSDILGVWQDAGRWLRKPYDRASMEQENRAAGVISLN